MAERDLVDELEAGVRASVVRANLAGVGSLALWSLLPPRLSPPAVPYALMAGVNIACGVVYVLVIMPAVSRRLVRRRIAPLASWLRSDRPPTPVEVRRLVAQPVGHMAVNALWWLGAIGWMTALNMTFLYEPRDWPLLRFSLAIVLCGYAAFVLGLVLVERTLRPAYTRAFAVAAVPPSRSQGVGSWLALLWGVAGAVPLVGVAAAVTGLDADQMAQIRLSLQELCAVGIAMGGFITFLGARSLIAPVAAVDAAVRAVGRGDLDVAVPADRAGQLGAVQAGFNQMVTGLRDRRRLESLFGRHVGTEVAAHAVAQGLVMTAERTSASLVFVRFRGVAGAPFRVDPAEAVSDLNAVLETIVAIVGSERGWVNKLSDQGAMCVFGPPLDLVDHGAAALRASRALRAELADTTYLGGHLGIAIGVATGTVVAGNVGASNRYEYTMIGEPVNAAARLAEAAWHRPTGLVASADTVAGVGAEAAEWEPAGEVELRGWREPTEILVPRSPAPVSGR